MSTFDDLYEDQNIANWINYPNIATPLNQVNLRALNAAIKKLFDGLYAESRDKVTTDSSTSWLKDLSFNSDTGIFTATRVNNTTFTIDTKLEKLAVNFTYDSDPTSAHYQSLIITLDDGTIQYVDMSALLTQYEFVDTATIDMQVDSSGRVSARIIDHSIGDDQMQTGYLANVTAQAGNAAASAESAAQSASSASVSRDDAKDNAILSESWAVGGTGERQGEDTNNSKFWAEKAEGIYQALGSALHPMGTITFANLPDFVNVEPGYMYNISDAFTSDSRFKDGSGIHYDAGADVYAIQEGSTWYWDVLTPIDMSGKMNTDGKNASDLVNLPNRLVVGPYSGSGNEMKQNSFRVGASHRFVQANSAAIGSDGYVNGANSLVVGDYCLTSPNCSVAIGRHATTHSSNSYVHDEMFAIGSNKKENSTTKITLPPYNNQPETDYYNIFVVDACGGVYMHGAPYQVRGVVVNRLVAQGDEIELEDGAEYILYTHTRMTSNGTWRGMQAYLISATFNPFGKSTGIGTTTTAQAVPQIASLGATGTVGCNVTKTYEEYVNKLGNIAYHSKIVIGTCTTNMTCRYSLLKVVGSEADFADDYDI